LVFKRIECRKKFRAHLNLQLLSNFCAHPVSRHQRLKTIFMPNSPPWTPKVQFAVNEWNKGDEIEGLQEIGRIGSLGHARIRSVGDRNEKAKPYLEAK
jgi:hypothetical protein